ncbi:hypothetical protein MLD38_005013 [Melastoma candidum]|uniref:Uncharacterized protein n=1 Tax=Melastoma candidum TaxID=119954 RepID=A0ACB9S792_9MYRT|nr:hypothetical protein MLD38_005013 [Melastoma candidum]
MGSGNSKIDGDEALCLCKARKDFVRQAVESRYALSSAHWCYLLSLRSISIALRRNPVSPPTTRMSHIRSGSAASMTIRFSPSCRTGYLDGDESVNFEHHHPLFHLSPEHRGTSLNLLMMPTFLAQQCPKAADLSCRSRFGRSVALVSSEACLRLTEAANEHQLGTECRADAPVNSLQRAHSISEKEKPLLTARFCIAKEDPSEFIRRRIFFQASRISSTNFSRCQNQAGKFPVVEGNKVRVGYPAEKGHPSQLTMLAAFQHDCCRKKATISYSADEG